MKWKRYPLRDDDAKAKNHFLDTFAMGASDHALSKRLTEKFANAKGPMFAIALESLNLNKITEYRCAGTYAGGKLWHDATGTYRLAIGDRPIDGLLEFLEKYLRGSPETVVLCENWMFARSDLDTWTSRESRVLSFGEELYHVATCRDADNRDLLEATVREPKRQWLTAVCSRCEVVPENEITSEKFFDEIVANTAYIFVSAFDGEGYLVWSPSSS